MTPIIIWILAFLIWFFWRDITRLLNLRGPATTVPGVSRENGRTQPRRENKSREKIPEEDRKKLDDILKNR